MKLLVAAGLGVGDTVSLYWYLREQTEPFAVYCSPHNYRAFCFLKAHGKNLSLFHTLHRGANLRPFLGDAEILGETSPTEYAELSRPEWSALPYDDQQIVSMEQYGFWRHHGQVMELDGLTLAEENWIGIQSRARWSFKDMRVLEHVRYPLPVVYYSERTNPVPEYLPKVEDLDLVALAERIAACKLFIGANSGLTVLAALMGKRTIMLHWVEGLMCSGPAQGDHSQPCRKSTGVGCFPRGRDLLNPTVSQIRVAIDQVLAL